MAAPGDKRAGSQSPRVGKTVGVYEKPAKRGLNSRAAVYAGVIAVAAAITGIVVYLN